MSSGGLLLLLGLLTLWAELTPVSSRDRPMFFYLPAEPGDPPPPPPFTPLPPPPFTSPFTPPPPPPFKEKTGQPFEML
nr:Kunitz-type peptide [Vipera transcaucasiana]